MKNGGFWLAALVGGVLDRLTKLWVAKTMVLGQSIAAIPGILDFTYIENTGAAWSLFQDSGGFLKWISLAVALVLVGLAIWGNRLQRWEQVGYGCILAGAIGNGIDRFVSGAVVDFLDISPLLEFPVFNIADVCINVGVACLLISLVATSRSQQSDR
jgi:signal peptidase II